MKLETVIDVLTDLSGDCPQFSPGIHRNALKIAIEAVKQEVKRRRFAIPIEIYLLPGETKE